MRDGTIWGIHGGKTGDADSLFLKKNSVAIGWAKIGDLSKIASDREAFKAAVAKSYPDTKPGAIPTNAGQMYRFVNEMQVGDLVVYPSKRDRQVHIGRIEGGYCFDPSLEESYPNLRPEVVEDPSENALHPRSSVRDWIGDELFPGEDVRGGVQSRCRR